MPVLRSSVDLRSEAARANAAENRSSIETLLGHLATAQAGGGAKYTDRHIQRGKLLPRQRIDLLLDRDSPFLELMPLAGMHVSGQVPGAAVVAGMGWVCGTQVLITASEATVQGGAIGEWGVKKSNRLAQIAVENELPVVHLIESAGADLPNQAEIFVPGGAGFRAIARRSARRIPTISLVFGSCTAGGAYIPGMSDYTVMVKDAAYMYLAGPPLVKMAIGEDVENESLGGAAMHSAVSGVSDYLAEDERDALRIGRELVAGLRWTPKGPGRDAVPVPPRLPASELLAVTSSDVRQPFDVREVLARVVDDSSFMEFKPLYGSTLVCGQAHIDGFAIGILANNGILFTESANKGAQFIQLMNQSDTPLLFLQNITGFMVGEAAERSGIIKAGAKLINAVSNSTVPAITLMVGGSYGAGNYAMMGRAYQPRFLFTWPNHKIAVMGPEQLAGVLDIVKRQAAARRGTEVNEEQLTMMKQMLSGKVAHESTAWSATGRLWDDGVIDPRDTRTVLSMALSAVHSAPVRGASAWGTFRH